MLNIAVEPGVEVTAAVRPAAGGLTEVVIDAADYGHRYRYRLDAPPRLHPMLEAAVAESGLPAGVDLELGVRSAVPPGAGAGTSAAVTVAVIAAIDRLRGEVRPAMELARAAHRVETVRLGRQSGVQDQLASAHGGVSFITIDAYPDVVVERVEISTDLAAELDRRLLLVDLGRSHDSAAVHREVIAELEGSRSEADRRLEPLRVAALDGRVALLRGDLDGLAAAMRASTVAQRRLHPALVSAVADRIFGAAAESGAAGWKVNGAGGAGGSVTVLCGVTQNRQALVERLTSAGEGVVILPARLAATGATAEVVQ